MRCARVETISTCSRQASKHSWGAIEGKKGKKNTSIYDQQRSYRHHLPVSTGTGRLSTCSLGDGDTASTAVRMISIEVKKVAGNYGLLGTFAVLAFAPISCSNDGDGLDVLL